MSAVDLAELRSDGFAVTPLPDEAGRMRCVETRGVRYRHFSSGEMIGEITASSTGGPGRYVIRFVET